jgi:DNA-binding CsgD family transcriptional regulator
VSPLSRRPPSKAGRLSHRELEIMRLIGMGHRSQDVAEILVISKRTVDFHLSSVFTKLGVSNRLQAMKAVRAFGLLPFEPSAGLSSWTAG